MPIMRSRNQRIAPAPTRMVSVPPRTVEQRWWQGVDEVVGGNAERRDVFEWPVPVWSGVDSAGGDGEELR